MKSIVSGCKSSRLNFENEIEEKKFVRMKKKYIKSQKNQFYV
jgi:hypothetical protein